MQTLDEFYGFMDRVQTVRRTATAYYLIGTHQPNHAESLANALSAIDALPGNRTDKTLQAGDRQVTVTLDYERNELQKDIFFLEHDDDEFFSYLSDAHDGFAGEVEDAVQFLRSNRPSAFVSDRDGTVNNYCGRYRSSHQPIWNAVYLTRYAQDVVDAPVILTSAPLTNGGLLDLTAMPERSTSYAGSLGREYSDRAGRTGAMDIDPTQAAALSRLNERIDALLSEPDFRVFALIGSGLQHKFGQTTVARQDIHGSIPDDHSARFLDAIRSAVHEVDSAGETFGIEDTGKDIEIMLTVDGARGFSKGDGLEYLNEALGLGVTEAASLICGDTASDLAMAEKAVELGGADRAAALFVTRDEGLRRAVKGAVRRCHFVSTPDVLVTALYRIAGEHGARREE